jgi:predicted nucleic acid-binding protein
MTTAFHSGYVVDASVAVKWFTREVHTENALDLLDHFRAGRCRLAVPGWLFFLEVSNALSRKPGFNKESVLESLTKAWNLQADLLETKLDLITKTTAIAYASKASVYDSAYVAVAEATGFPLVTADEELLKRMKGHSLVLPVWDLEFPATAGA